MAKNKWVHGVATLLIGVITPCMTGAHLVVANNSGKKNNYICVALPAGGIMI